MALQEKYSLFSPLEIQEHIAEDRGEKNFSIEVNCFNLTNKTFFSYNVTRIK